MNSRKDRGSTPLGGPRTEARTTIAARVIASCFAIACFAAALVVGIGAGNSAGTVIGRAILVMLVAWFIGWTVGGLAERAVDLEVGRHKERHPIASSADNNEPTEAAETPQEQTEQSGATTQNRSAAA